MATRKKQPARNTTDATTEGITVQRTGKCRTLGNGSQLTYQVGIDADRKDHIKLTAAAGGGFFSSESISLQSVLGTLDTWPADRPLTSCALAPLFRGKSANNPSFLAAVLVAEGVLRRKEGRKRHLERCEPTDPARGFDGFGTTQPAQKRQRKARTRKSPRSPTDQTEGTTPARKSPQSHTATTNNSPPRKVAKQRSR